MRYGSQFEFSPTVTITKIVAKTDPDVLFQNQKYLRNQKQILVTLTTSVAIKNTSEISTGISMYCLKLKTERHAGNGRAEPGTHGPTLVRTNRP